MGRSSGLRGLLLTSLWAGSVFAADVPGLAEVNTFNGTPASANSVADSRVNGNGVVIDLKDKDIATLPGVVYQGDGTAVVAYEAPTVAANFNPARFTGKNIRLSVGDVEVLALNYSWNLKKTLTERMQARAKKIAAFGAALPSPSISSTYKGVQRNATGTTRSLSGSTVFDASANISQPLFLGGSVISQFKEANLYNDFVSEDIRRVRLAVIYAIRNQYYLCILNKKTSEIYYDQKEIAKEYWEKTKKRYEADDVAEIDVLRYEVDYKIQEANYIQASNNFNVAVADLMRLIGLPLDTDVDFADPFEFADYNPGSEKNLTAEALRTRPEIAQAKLNEDMQKENIWQEKSELFPKIYAEAGGGNSNNYSYSYEARNNDWNWSAGLRVQWNALAGGGQIIRSKVIDAEAILDQYRFTTNDTVDQVRQDVRDSLLNLSSASDWVKSQQENVQQATRVLKQQTIRWDEGAGAYLDILDARDKLAQTQLLYWQGIYNYKTAVVSLDYAVGRFSSSADSLVKGYSVSKSAPRNNNQAAQPLPKPRSLNRVISEEFNRMPEPVRSSPVYERGASLPAQISQGVVPEVTEPEAEQVPPSGPQPIF